ncbi:hypothetical protein SLS62_011199 [Diatrype stigma]|uniref:Uncharacterized protein n=1 Tax=Diatrype stigma TaxID=117547 RepID=A0AAN9YFT9_9PEZI
MNPATCLIELAQGVFDFEKYYHWVRAFLEYVIDPNAEERAERFRVFWRERSQPIGFIKLFQIDPAAHAQFIASVVFKQKLGLAPSPEDYHPSRPPLIMVSWDSQYGEMTPNEKLACMISDAANLIHQIFPDPDTCEAYTRAHNPDHYCHERLQILENLISQKIGSFRWPFEHDTRKMVCLLVNIGAVTNRQTSEIVRRLISVLEDLFVTRRKGKLVFIGTNDYSLLNALTSRNRDRPVVIYEEDEPIHRPADSEAWNMNG